LTYPDASFAVAYAASQRSASLWKITGWPVNIPSQLLHRNPNTEPQDFPYKRRLWPKGPV